MNLNFSPSFIEVYDKALSSNECNILISQFEKSPQREGTVFKDGITTVDKDIKNSLEISGCSLSKPTTISSIINNSLKICFTKYREKYPIFINSMTHVEPFDSYTFKKFEGKSAGYKHWHHEHGPNVELSKRVLVWGFYLNDAPGTDFMFYPNVSGKEGRCVIFPASFNYMHRSSPNKGIKYIITGWFSYI